MSTTLDPRVIPHLSPATRLVAEPDPAGRSAPRDEPGLHAAPGVCGHTPRGPADGEDRGRAVEVEHGVRHLPPQYLWAEDSRWLLYLHDMDGLGNWHLFRVDLSAPDDPAVDLTPLSRGSQVVTVDALATVPDRVLVTMNATSRHTDYFLVDVATGESTAHLPSGPTGKAASPADRRC